MAKRKRGFYSLGTRFRSIAGVLRAIRREARIAVREQADSVCDEENISVEILPTDKVPSDWKAPAGFEVIAGNNEHYAFRETIAAAREMAAQCGGTVWVDVALRATVTVTVEAVGMPRWIPKAERGETAKQRSRRFREAGY